MRSASSRTEGGGAESPLLSPSAPAVLSASPSASSSPSAVHLQTRDVKIQCAFRVSFCFEKAISSPERNW